MAMKPKKILIAVLLLAIFGGVYWFWKNQAEAAAKSARNSIPVVKIASAEQKTMPITVVANGYVTPIKTVDVRPQTQNIVRAVHVLEGQEVRAGQLLFTLDERSDASSVDKARAQVARDRADLTDAENILKRNEELLERKFVSPAVVDSARSKVESLRGTLQADQALVQSSQVMLSYNRITASMSGRLGAVNVHPGSLAQPTATPLVTIAQMDPITVSFSLPERELAHILATYPKGDAPVIVNTPGGKEMEGKLVFIDNTADSQTGTIKMKAQFSNTQRVLWPGAYVNVRLISRSLPTAVVIPAQAIVTGPVDKRVYVLEAENTVKAQKIEIIKIEAGQAAVTGLEAGARVVIEGAQNLRPGSKVREQAAVAGEDMNKKNNKKREDQVGK